MARYVPTTISNILNAVTSINTNYNNIKTAIDRMLSRYGSDGTNTMNTGIDMNSNRITNLPVPVDNNEPARYGDIIPYVTAASGSASAAAASAASAASNANNASSSAASAAASALLAGVFGNSNIVFFTVSEATSSRLPSAPNFITTICHTSYDSGGGARYAKVAVQPDHPAKIMLTLADGTQSWYEIAEAQVDVTMLGVLFEAKWTGGQGSSVPTGSFSTTAWQSVADYISIVGAATGAPVVLTMPGGTTKIGASIDFTACTEGFALVGKGLEQTIIYCSNFGRNAKLFNLDFTISSINSRVQWVNFYNFMIVGNNDVDDPITFFRPWSSTDHWYVKVLGVDNIVLYNEEADNCDYDLWLSGCGYQHLHRLDGAVYATAVGTTVTAVNSSGVAIPGHFTGMSGKTIFVEEGDTTVAGGKAWGLRTIVAPTGDGSTATIDVAFTSGTPAGTFTIADNKRFSWGPLLGSITTGTKTLTISDNVMTTADIGRYVFIARADGSNNSVLCTKITNVSGTTITVADNAGQTVTNEEVWVAPPIVLAPQKSRASTGTTNDVKFRGRNEGFAGPGALIDQALNVRFDMWKSHGLLNTSNNMARSRQHLVISQSDVHTSHLTEWSPSYVAGHPTLTSTLNKGTILIVGGRSTCMISGIWATMPDNEYPVEMDTTDADSRLIFGPATVNSDPTKGTVKLGASALISQVLYGGATAWFTSAIPLPISYMNLSNLEITTKNNGAAASPFLTLRRKSDSPAAADILGQFRFRGNDNSGNDVSYAAIQAVIADPATGDGYLQLMGAPLGTLTAALSIKNGMWTPGATGSDPGAGKINLTNGVQVNGNDVLGSRKTGWTAATGTVSRATFVSDSVTLPQLAYRVKALIDDLISHGAIGS